MRKFALISSAAFASVLLLSPQGAKAAFVLTLDDLSIANIAGAPEVVVQDDTLAGVVGSTFKTTHTDGTGIGGTAEPGQISFNGSLGGLSTWTVNVTTGLSKPLFGPDPSLDINTVNVSTAGAGTLLISLTDTSFTPTANSINVGGGGTTDGTVVFSASIDPGDVEFALSGDAGIVTIVTAVLVGVGPTNVFSGSAASALVPAIAGPYSLTETALITHTAAGATSFNVITVVPIPGAVWLFGSGVLGLLGIGYSRRRQAAA